MQVEQSDKVPDDASVELENKIATLTGGRAAEEVVFGEVTTGASNDIEQATKLARAMITRYGMSDDFDMVAHGDGQQPVSGRRHHRWPVPRRRRREIDRKVVALVKAQHEKARQILNANRAKLDELAQFLYEKGDHHRRRIHADLQCGWQEGGFVKNETSFGLWMG